MATMRTMRGIFMFSFALVTAYLFLGIGTTAEGASSAGGGGSAAPDLVWLTPEPGQPLARLKSEVEARGGEIVTLAPERRILVRYPRDRAEALGAVPGVDSAEAMSVVEEPQGPTGKGLGDRPPTPEEEEAIRRAFKPVEQIAPNTLSEDRAVLQGLDTGPAKVDNSMSEYFPPIRSQGSQGSCTAWAAAYYYNTYTQAMDENLDVSGGDNNHICSPAFLYNLTNDGVDLGANTAFAVEMLNDIGTSSWNLQPYNVSDWTTWPSEAAWIDAIPRRTSEPYMIGDWYYGCSDADLEDIKQHLANGHIAVTRTDVYENWYYNYPNNTTGINNGVLFANGGGVPGGHAMTIVGYDDDKSYFDGAETRYGAFLIANSWGDWWGVPNTGGVNKGFMWVAYDYFKAANECFGVAYFNSDRPQYRPQLYAVTGMNHVERGYVTYYGGVGPTNMPVWYSHYAIQRAGGLDVAITDAKPVAVDLTDGITKIGFPSVQLFVIMAVSASSTETGTITSAVFYHDFDGNGNFLSVESPDPVVNVPPAEGMFATVAFDYEGTAIVPDVVGLPQGDAEAAITAAGLVVGVVIEEFSDTVPAGGVISQEPVGGTEVLTGSAVDMVLSLGPLVPIEISSIEELQLIGNDPAYPLDGHYVLTQHIDGSTAGSLNGGTGFIPIGTDTTPFTGAFDGQGHVITGLSIYRPEESDVGLFGVVGKGGVIQNLGLSVSPWGIGHVGCLAGVNSGVVSHCWATGSAIASGPMAGFAGGLIGVNGGTVTRCFAAGGVAGGDYLIAGGLVGGNYGTISECYATSSVSAGGEWGGTAGGLVGLHDDDGTISQCYANGEVTATSSAGGLVGSNNGGTVEFSFWDTETSGVTESAGGTDLPTAQMQTISTFTDAGWDFDSVWYMLSAGSYPYLSALPQGIVPDVSGLSKRDAIVAIEARDLMARLMYEYSNTIPEGQVISQYPPPGDELQPRGAVDLVVSLGSAAESIGLSSIEELQLIGNDPAYPLDGHYALTQEIDASATSDWNDGAGFDPIGTLDDGNPEAAFTGVFDGRGYVITNLHIDRPDEWYVGLFGFLGEDSVILNLGLEGGVVTGSLIAGSMVGLNDGELWECYARTSVMSNVTSSLSASAGGLVGVNDGTLSHCYATGTVTGNSIVGGLVGFNNSILFDCHATGEVLLPAVIVGWECEGNAGGLVGKNRATISECYATGAVTTTHKGDDAFITVGGLVGDNQSGVISDCYATGDVTGWYSAHSTFYLGGLVGRNEGHGVVFRSCASGAVAATYTSTICWYTGLLGGLAGFNSGSISQCCATGMVTDGDYQPFSNSGGLVGTNWGDISESYAMGGVAGTYDVGGLVGINGGSIYQCYAAGALTGESLGGLVGLNNDALIEDSFWDIDASGVTDSAGGTGLPTTQMKILSTFTNAGWNFDTVWHMFPRGSYPYLMSLPQCVVPDVTGFSEAEAVAELENAGLSAGISYGYSDTVPWGEVISEDPTADTLVEAGSVVAFVVSLGPDPRPGETAIGTVEELQLIGNDPDYPVDGNYYLTQDIDASVTASWNNGAGFMPIWGCWGQFDGQGHVISNLTINDPSQEGVGLFAAVGPGGVIRDLSLEDTSVTGMNNVGILAGSNSGTITLCHVSGSVTAGNESWYELRAGGLVGSNSGSLTSCSASCSVTAGDEFAFELYAGGLVGYNSGTVTSCSTVGAVTCTGSQMGFCGTGGLVGCNVNMVSSCYAMSLVTGGTNVGGAVGENHGTVSQSYATGEVGGTSNVGGLVGSNGGTVSGSYATGSSTATSGSGVGGLIGSNSGDTVFQCYATGAVTGYWDAGGLVGFMSASGGVSDCYASGSVTTTSEGMDHAGGLVGWNYGGTVLRCYAIGAVTGTDDVGGLIGLNEDGTVEFSFWDTETSSITVSDGGTGLPTAEMQTLSTFTDAGWDFDAIWYMLAGGSYPYLGNVPQSTVPDVVGLSGADAIAAIEAAGLEVRLSYEYSNTVSEGQIISQSVPSGENINAGTPVVLVVSLGPAPLVSVPDVVGLPQADAEAAILAAELAVGAVTEQYSDTVPVGDVISQEPAGGTEVPAGSAVDLVVSLGPPPIVTVPDVVGLPEADAAAAIVAADLTVGTVNYEYSDTVPAGHVISQAPIGGTEVAAGSTVDLVVSLGLPGIAITTIDALQLIGNDAGYPIDGNYVLTQDIDASATAGWNSGAGFAPIGTSAAPFIGTFDGQGYVITGLTINRPGQNYVGLFAAVGAGGTVRDVGIEGTVSGAQNVGALAGSNGGSVSGCRTTGSVTGASFGVGGLVGLNQASGTVTACYAGSSVTNSASNWTGGLVGHNQGQITQSYATGDVAGSVVWGGLVGLNNGGAVTDCYATGAATGADYGGGLLGRNINSGTVSRCYSTGAVSGTANVGGFAGLNDSGTFTGCFWDTETSGMAASSGGTGLTTAAMQTLSTFTDAGWDFDAVWYVLTGGSYPYLGNLPQASVPDVSAMTEADAIAALEAAGLVPRVTYEYSNTVPEEGIISQSVPAGSSINVGISVNLVVSLGPAPKEISSIDELQLIGNDPEYPLNGHYLLTQDIDASATAGWNDGAGFAPIGTWDLEHPELAFTGSLDGQGYVIRNLFIDRPDENYVGLFAVIGPGAAVRNLAIESAGITGGGYVGSLAGDNEGTVARCCATGTVNGDLYVGGLMGVNFSTGTASECYAVVAVTGMDPVGGLVGDNEGLISACYAMGSVEASGNTGGGLVGLNYNGSVSRCYAAGAVTGGTFLGGLIGFNDNGSVGDSFWDTETSGVAEPGEGTGLTTAEMQTQSTFTDAGWDFDAVWYMLDGGSYPYLDNLPQREIPDVSGMEEAEARASIQAEGLTVCLAYEDSGTVPEGHVIRQNPVGGSFINAGTPVLLVVSGSPPPIAISSIEELQLIGNHPDYPLDGDYVLAHDISASATPGWNSGAGFAPIGTPAAPFIGTFDGQGYVVTGLTINRPDTHTVGLFSSVGAEGIIENLGIENATVTGNSGVGCLVGFNAGGTISQCHATGIVNGGDLYVGCLVGYNGPGTISECHATTILNGIEDVGGLVGFNSGTITGCHATGTVTGSTNVGGLVGTNDLHTVSQCYASGTVTASEGCAGGLAGRNAGTVTECYATGPISASGVYEGVLAGGLVGHNGGEVTACHATGSATSTEHAGGLAGRNEGTVTDCYAIGQVTAVESAGGLVGYHFNGSVSQAYALGTVSSTHESTAIAGGLMGTVWGGSVSECYAAGAVTAAGETSGMAGGLAGNSINATFSQCYAIGPVSSAMYASGLVGSIFGGGISHCYAAGRVSSYIGTPRGLVALNNDGAPVEASFWDIQTTCASQSNGGGTPLTTPEMQTESTFTDAGWNFVGVWYMLPGGFYPYLGNVPQTTVPDVLTLSEPEAMAALEAAGFSVSISYEYIDTHPGGVVISQDPSGALPVNAGTPINIVVSREIIAISSIEELQLIGTDSDYPLEWHYVLTQDIDASATASWNDGAGFVPIGEFTGNFDGQGFVVTNLTINRPDEDYAGLFRSIGSRGVVQNLGLESADVTGGGSAGCLAATNSGFISGCYVTSAVTALAEPSAVAGGLLASNSGTVFQCSATGSVTGRTVVGGLVGSGGGTSTISECYANCEVTGGSFYAGGLLAANSSAGTVSRCYATGPVMGTGFAAGGLIAANSGAVFDCYATGDVSGESNQELGGFGVIVGGLVGGNDEGTVSRSYATGPVTGTAPSGTIYVGGLIGYNPEGAIEASVWDIQTSGVTESAGGTGLTTAEMLTLTHFTNSGWDFDSCWGMEGAYAYLQAFPVCTLSYSAASEGMISGASVQTVNVMSSGSDVLAAGVPGFSFAQWSDAVTDNPRRDTNVTADLEVTAEFAPNTYTVTFDARGGMTPVPPSKQVTFGEPYGALFTTSLEGYIFGGWFTEVAGGTEVTESTIVTTAADHTLYARWIETYTLSYSAGPNGAIEGDIEQTVAHGADGTSVEAVPAEGYHFKQWSDAATDNPRRDTNVTADLAVTAEFAPNTYTVTFDAQGGMTPVPPPSKQVTYREPYGELAITSREGYTFDGWFTAAAGGSQVTSSTIVTKTVDHTLYAQWTIKSYILTYNAGANGMIEGELEQSVDHGADGTPVEAVPAEGYHFKQWSDAATDNPRRDTSVTADLAVTAEFAPNSYTVTFDARGGSVPIPQSKTATFDMPYGVLPNISREGYTFDGWFTAPTSGTQITSSTIVTETADHTLYAQWTIKSYTLAYGTGANGTLKGELEQTVDHGADGTPVEAVPAEGYHFKQWSDGATGNPRTDTSVTQNIAVTAEFVINEYRLIYTAGEHGTIQGERNQTVLYGANGTPVKAIPNEGYLFGQWSDGSIENPRTDANVKDNVYVTANFVVETGALVVTILPQAAVDNGAMWRHVALDVTKNELDVALGHMFRIGDPVLEGGVLEVPLLLFRGDDAASADITDENGRFITGPAPAEFAFEVVHDPSVLAFRNDADGQPGVRPSDNLRSWYGHEVTATEPNGPDSGRVRVVFANPHANQPVTTVDNVRDDGSPADRENPFLLATMYFECSLDAVNATTPLLIENAVATDGEHMLETIDAQPIVIKADVSGWLPSGHSESDLHPGSYLIEFNDIPGWRRPDMFTVDVEGGEMARETGAYADASGSLRVIIQPEAAVADGAKWRRAGTSTWLDSAFTEERVPEGLCEIEFKDVTDWNTPENLTSTITVGETTTIEGEYTVYTGSLRVVMGPQEATEAGAQWRRMGTSTWRDSGTTEADVPVGEYTVEFKPISGWEVSDNVMVTVKANQTAQVSVSYTLDTRLPGCRLLNNKAFQPFAEASVYEPVLPSMVEENGARLCASLAPLAVRLRSSEAIDPDTVWGVVSWREAAPEEVLWLPLDEGDGWAVFEPEEAWLDGEAITFTAGAYTVSGQEVGPFTYEFVVNSDVYEGSAAVVESGLTTGDPEFVGMAYEIAPNTVYYEPLTVQLPVPEGVGAGALEPAYLFTGEDGERRWVDGTHVIGWLEPGSVRTVQLPDGVYLEFQVNHGGTVQLRRRVVSVSSAGMNNETVSSDLLLFLALCGVLVVRKRRWVGSFGSGAFAAGQACKERGRIRPR